MSFYRFNMILGWVLFAALVLFGIRELTGFLMTPKELAEPAYQVAGAEEPAPTDAKPGEATPGEAAPGEAAPGEAALGETAPSPEMPLDQLLAAASPDKGQAAAKKCVACHSFDKGGANKIGPNLWGIVDRDIGTADGFKYSDALTAKAGNWTYDALSAFLTDPKAFAPGTRMAFGGIKGAADRADLIVYLRGLADSPKPLPGK
jgi:cytochrome c